ncbi:hypothetical protein F5890DRAFT_1559746 [Lentinula detonsa]|uniref:Uncharacterized protein n=1 Tax=Lentinula detonsa TaxID=2804962 RepID=A0AA38UMI0_9AGAR|nr:hypothetical protein F5890DRAFT_1559746 [Lentinula detonsa]
MRTTDAHDRNMRASWTKAHFGFWDSKPEAELLYRYWKPKEWKMGKRDSPIRWLSIYKTTEMSGLRLSQQLIQMRNWKRFAQEDLQRPFRAAARGKVDPPLVALVVGSEDTALETESALLSTSTAKLANDVKITKPVPSVVVNPIMHSPGNVETNPLSKKFNDLAFSHFLAYTDFSSSVIAHHPFPNTPPEYIEIYECTTILS